jgi:hypothetical protein
VSRSQRPNERLTIVVFGLIGSLPIAGLTAHYLQYVLGLRALGHDVLYLEDTGWYWDPWSASYVDEWSVKRVSDRGYPNPARRLQRLLLPYGLDRQWSWIDIDGTEYGVSGPALARTLRRADLLVHVTGANRIRERYLEIPCRAYVDTDPGYTQMRAARDHHRADLELLESHTVHFSFAGNINHPTCTIPHVGLQWRPTRQPLHFPMWPPAPPAADAPFSTIVKWVPYKPIEYEGVIYGMKDVEFLRFIDLPQRQSSRLTLAMEGAPPVPRSELHKRGWLIEDGLTVSKNLLSYRKFIASSRGEWSIAKHGYVATNSGWFSDRSASYMAMGRPVIVQSTGFENWLPTGEGLHSFATMDDAVAALGMVQADYARHRRRAREIAHEYFDARFVLSELIAQAISGPVRGARPKRPTVS